jgi:WhiB family redox-sensing transcriptional regulator
MSFSWMDSAACKKHADLFDETYHTQDAVVVEAAKQVCETCPVLDSCRAHSTTEAFGVWAGTDEDERRASRRRRGVGPKGPYTVTGAAKRLAQIGEMTAQGLSTQEIAFRMAMSPVTVERRQGMLRAQARAAEQQRVDPKPECGTDAGYKRHQRRLETPCTPCTSAHAEVTRKFKSRRAVA